MTTPEFRIGQGYDVHQFAADCPLFLGGVAIPSDRGLLGHSDADVLLHALMDALLGAAALGDIGQHFPPSDPTYRGIASGKLLAQVRSLLEAAGWQVVNVDCTIIAERPKIAPYTSAMRDTIGAILGLSSERIGIKATTNERLGFVGREEGIAALAVALLTRPTPAE